MEPFILATGILIGSAVSQGNINHRHPHVETRVHYHSDHCPDSHFRSTFTYRSPRPRYRHYRPRLRPVTYRRHHFHKKHTYIKPRVRSGVRYRPINTRTQTRSSRSRLRKI